jgi:hypothetical protein
MTKHQKIYDQIKQAENNMAEALREVDKALSLLDELYFESESTIAERIKLRLSCYVSEKVRFVPMELENVAKDLLKSFRIVS